MLLLLLLEEPLLLLLLLEEPQLPGLLHQEVLHLPQL